MSVRQFVFTREAAALQRLLDWVQRGYPLWTSGEVPLAKGPALIAKFQQRYRTDANKDLRYRLRRQGQAAAALVLLYRPASATLCWWLLVPRDGEQLAHRLERLQDAATRSGRLNCHGLELVQLVHPHSGKLRWTWRLGAELERTKRERLIVAIRQRDFQEEAGIQYELWQLPGFGGVRTQIGKLAALRRAEHRRRGNPQPAPWPAFLPYLRRQASDERNGCWMHQLQR
ncbi:hypothetical protein OL229_16135 [Neisseriaceae bacterium JH1-16]|nr:hypothetical protein [Neisseriaceae bacterium JH1-16]